jgi:hypothetical protein
MPSSFRYVQLITPPPFEPPSPINWAPSPTNPPIALKTPLASSRSSSPEQKPQKPKPSSSPGKKPGPGRSSQGEIQAPVVAAARAKPMDGSKAAEEQEERPRRTTRAMAKPAPAAPGMILSFPCFKC